MNLINDKEEDMDACLFNALKKNENKSGAEKNENNNNSEPEVLNTNKSKSNSARASLRNSLMQDSVLNEFIDKSCRGYEIIEIDGSGHPHKSKLQLSVDCKVIRARSGFFELLKDTKILHGFQTESMKKGLHFLPEDLAFSLENETGSIDFVC